MMLGDKKYILKKRELILRYYDEACKKLSTVSMNYFSNQARPGVEDEFEKYREECMVLRDVLLQYPDLSFSDPIFSIIGRIEKWEPEDPTGIGNDYYLYVMDGDGNIRIIKADVTFDFLEYMKERLQRGKTGQGVQMQFTVSNETQNIVRYEWL